MRLRRKFASLACWLTVCGCTCFAGETATLRNGFTIHYQHRESRGEVTRLYLSESADSFVDVPADDIIEIETDSTPPAAPKVKPQTARPTHPIDLEEALSAASRHYNVSPDLLRSVIRAESGFKADAVSTRGAQGLMQLMPKTAAQLGVRNAFDPIENLDGGAHYLNQLLARYHNDLPTALAAYNAGPQRVEQYHGIPPYRETLSYIMRVLRDLEPEKSGVRRLTPLTYDHHTPGSFQVSRTKTAAVTSRAEAVPDASNAADGNNGDEE